MLAKAARRGLSAPVNLTWEITLRCNFRCRHCLSGAGQAIDGELSTEECHRILDELAALKVFQINIGGGEPFLRPDIFDILHRAEKLGMVSCVSTNGSLMDPDTCKRLASIEGLYLQVSLDAADEASNDSIRGKGTYKHALRALEELSRHAIPFSINTVLTRISFPQIDTLKVLAHDMGANLRVSRFRPSGRARECRQELSPTKEQLESFSHWLQEHSQVLTGDSFFSLTSEKRRRMGMDMCGAAKMTCCLAPDGSLYPCAFLQEPEFLAGNIREMTLGEVWHHSKIFRELRGLEVRSCEACFRFDSCRGGCPRHGVLHTRRPGPTRSGMPHTLHKRSIMTFSRLLSHIDIGRVRAKNRIVFPAHRTNLAGKGCVSDDLVHYYRARAQGGCGVIVVGELTVHPNDRPYLKMIELHHSRSLNGLRTLARAVKESGALAIGQLTHRGFQSQGAVSRLPLWGPEPLADIVHGETCKQMEQSDIIELVSAFADGARLLSEAGFDGIEIDVGETSLLRQFLSPLTNHRQDDYGGDLTNRLRLTEEILHAVKRAVGPDFPVGVRLCLDEVFWGALTIEEAVACGQKLGERCLSDYFGTAIGTYYNLYLTQASMHNPAGLTLEKTSILKAAVRVPVIAGNRIHTPALAEKVLEDGQADMIGWIRPLICDPDLPKKIEQERFEEIVFCVSDNQNCVGRGSRLKPIACIQNPWAGREALQPATPAAPVKTRHKVVVVGAGPAGLQAALTAASSGHDVTVLEREKEPGGQLRFARLGAGRQPIWHVVENLTRRLRTRDVTVLTEFEATPENVLAQSPDAIIVATGSFPHPGPVPGNYSPPTVLNVWQALQDPDSAGERVMLVDENGHQQAIATAEFLADCGRRVDIMTSEPFVGMELAQTGDLYLSRQRLLGKSVRFLPDRVLLEINGTVMKVTDKFTEEISFLEGYDTIVLVMGNVPEDTLYKELKRNFPKVVRVGDCVAPRRIDMAIFEGNRAALAL